MEKQKLVSMRGTTESKIKSNSHSRYIYTHTKHQKYIQWQTQ